MLDPRLSSYLQVAVDAFLIHTYTRTTTQAVLDGVDPTYDGEGHQIFEDAPPESEIPCLLLWQDENVTTQDGVVIRKIPVMYVKPDDTTAIGDRITNITDQGLNILLSAAQVNVIQETVEAGSNVVRVLQLQGAIV